MAIKKKQKIKRETATKVLYEVLKRAEEINADDSFCYGVEKIVLFGSYKKEKFDYVGDLDLMVRVIQKVGSNDGNREEFDVALNKERNLSPRGGLNALFFPYERAIKKLKDGSRTLSLHEYDLENGKVGPQEDVFNAELSWSAE